MYIYTQAEYLTTWIWLEDLSDVIMYKNMVILFLNDTHETIKIFSWF